MCNITTGMVTKLSSRQRNPKSLGDRHGSSEQEEDPGWIKVVDDNPLMGYTEREQQIDIKIPFRSLAVATATAQISSLVFCLAWSIKFNFHESTATHCRVANYLPSLSATLDFTPQRDIWRSCIGLSGFPRYFIAFLYYRIIFLSRLLLWLHWIEISALIGLSIVDSIRYFGK